MDATRNFLKAVIADDNSDWYPSMVNEWRIVRVRDGDQLLEHMEPGYWIAFELSNSIDTKESEPHLRHFDALEKLWRETAPLKVRLHHGKAHAYGPVEGTNYSNGKPFPFQNTTFLKDTYTQPVIDSFVSKMNSYDPNRVFQAGALAHMLGVSNITHDPRIASGLSCDVNEDCASECCCNHALCAFPLSKYYACMQPSTNFGHRCVMDCECVSPLRCLGSASGYICQ